MEDRIKVHKLNSLLLTYDEFITDLRRLSQMYKFNKTNLFRNCFTNNLKEYYMTTKINLEIFSDSMKKFIKEYKELNGLDINNHEDIKDVFVKAVKYMKDIRKTYPNESFNFCKDKNKENIHFSPIKSLYTTHERLSDYTLRSIGSDTCTYNNRYIFSENNDFTDYIVDIFVTTIKSINDAKNRLEYLKKQASINDNRLGNNLNRDLLFKDQLFLNDINTFSDCNQNFMSSTNNIFSSHKNTISNLNEELPDNQNLFSDENINGILNKLRIFKSMFTSVFNKIFIKDDFYKSFEISKTITELKK